MLIEITQENIDGFEARRAVLGGCRSGSCPVAHGITISHRKTRLRGRPHLELRGGHWWGVEGTPLCGRGLD